MSELDSSQPSKDTRPIGSTDRSLFQVVLHEPEIPNNTGNIGRTCVATGCALHLIHPLGFDITEKACRRAGLDYWPRLRVTEHESWDSYRRDVPIPEPRLWLFTTRAKRCIFDIELHEGDHLVFGKESAGLPQSIRDSMSIQQVGFPLVTGERSMNLSTIVGAAVYEGLRQLHVRKQIGISNQLRLRSKSEHTSIA
jgi:tRNA (cytidine/uridine-2'-O-)-methyltransferase